MISWHILTGEYPPQPGGVSDYTRLVAESLSASGDAVTIWAPPEVKVTYDCSARVHVRRLPDHFGARGLLVLDRALKQRGSHSIRILVQYVPHAFGCRAMNLRFCWWLVACARRHQVSTMFHEVAYPVAWGQPLKHNVLGAVNRLMAWLVASASSRILVTIPAWEEMLRPMLSRRQTVEWVPVPATVLTRVDAASVASLRHALAADGKIIVGHFGTFGSTVSRLLFEVLPLLLCQDSRLAVLIGRGGVAFASELFLCHPELRRRLIATGELTAAEVSIHLSACDLLVQPYPDGVSCRRTSAMAGLALGVPIVTTSGHLTEPLWEESGAVALAPAGRPAELFSTASRLLAEPARLADMSTKARQLYNTRFSLEQTVMALRQPRINGLGGSPVYGTQIR